MVSDSYKKRVSKLVKQAKEKGKITKYTDFCKTKLAEETALTDEETAYYISKKREETK